MNRFLAVFAVLAIGMQGAHAQNAGVNVELNKLETSKGMCRVYLIFDNKTASAFRSLNLELVLFDKQDIIARRIAVEAAPLPANRMNVRIFGIEQVSCANIGRILLNDVLACEDATGPRKDCPTIVTTSSRSPVPFVR